VLNAINPLKDVDCFHAENVGRLAQGKPRFVPCTPAGVLEILRHYNIPTQGKNVVIINRSSVVGQPLSLLLSQEPWNATVTVCHEHSRLPNAALSEAHIVITAVGKYPKYQLLPEWVRPGAVVIDVAMNRYGGKLFGDVVDFEGMKRRVSLITPVPGGVGPLTVAFLLKNTLQAAISRRGFNETGV